MKKHLILNIALLIVGALAFLVIMPFINFQEFNDTAFAMTNTECSKCHGGPYDPGPWPDCIRTLPNYFCNPNFSAMKEKHHEYYDPSAPNCMYYCHANYPHLGSDSGNCVDCHTSGSICNSTDPEHRDCKLAAHNNASLDSADCSSCHATNVVTEHFKYILTYNRTCGLCHIYNTDPNVVNTVAKGSGVNGQTVYCTSCHVTTNHLAQHDHAKIDSTTCTQCHQANVVTEHANRNLSCATCHSSTVTKVIDAINKGKGTSGQDVFCSDCHGTVDHAAAHTKIVYFLDHITSGCTVCHKTDALQEHSTYFVTCAACHDNSPYQEVIAQAVNTNAPAVTCEECHDGVYHPTDVDKTAHDTTKITYPGSDCINCHSSSDAVTEHDKYNVDCYDCHTNNSLTKNNNLTYQQVISNAIKQVFSNGIKADPNPVSCTDCHGTAVDHLDAHNNVSKTYGSANGCTSCHGTTLATMADINTVHLNDCATCHSSPRQVVIDAINNGKGSGTAVATCATCHPTGHNTELDHNNVSKTYGSANGCTSCHGTTLDTMADINTVHLNDCARCHSSTRQVVKDAINNGKGSGTAVATCATCHPTGHNTESDHNNVSKTYGSANGCTSCHGTTLATMADINTVHLNDCVRCHSSARQVVKDAINNGKGTGTAVATCATCHGTVDHTAVHDYKVVIPYADCGSCHATNVVTEHENHNKTCSDCHNDTYQAVMSKSTVYCADCHVIFGNHSSQHNAIAALQTSCASCHAGSYIALHENTAIYCFACHTSQSALVATAIDNGMAGTSVQCSNCHATTCSYGNQSPVANAGADQTVQTGQSVSFSGAGSYDPDGTITSYAWNFGDGSTGSGVTTSPHTYTTAGTYTVTLTVTDNMGATGTDTAVITVQAQISIYADQVLWIQNLSSSTNSDSSVSSSYRTDITTRFKDNILTDTFTIYNKSPYKVIAMKLNKDAGLYSQVMINLYVKSLYNNSSQTVKIYPYNSDGNSINTSYSTSYTISKTGWTQIDLTSLASRMKGFGWMKFRITCTSTSLDVAEGNFMVK